MERVRTLFSPNPLMTGKWRRFGCFPFNLGQKVVVEGMDDKLSWTETKDGEFSVKSMNISLQPRYSKSFPWLWVWRFDVQSKICFFSWETIWGKILTMDRLQKRAFPLAMLSLS